MLNLYSKVANTTPLQKIKNRVYIVDKRTIKLLFSKQALLVLVHGDSWWGVSGVERGVSGAKMGVSV